MKDSIYGFRTFNKLSSTLTHEERVQLGIRGCLKSGHQPYTDEEIQYLIDNYGVIPLKQIAINLGRTYYSVVDKRKKLIRHHNIRFYTRDEDNFIIQNSLKLTSYEVAEKLGRSRASVSQRAIRLGIKFIKVADDSPKTVYPQEDIDLIRELRDTGLTYYSIGKKFEIHKSYIRQICNFERRLYDNTQSYHQMVALQKDAISMRS